MVFLWFSYGFPMVFLWFSYGFPIDIPNQSSDVEVSTVIGVPRFSSSISIDGIWTMLDHLAIPRVPRVPHFGKPPNGGFHPWGMPFIAVWKKDWNILCYYGWWLGLLSILWQCAIPSITRSGWHWLYHMTCTEESCKFDPRKAVLPGSWSRISRGLKPDDAECVCLFLYIPAISHEWPLMRLFGTLLFDATSSWTSPSCGGNIIASLPACTLFHIFLGVTGDAASPWMFCRCFGVWRALRVEGLGALRPS